MRLHLLLVFLIALFLSKQSAAQQAEINAFPTDEKIVLDGILNEAAWLNAQRVDQFTQRELNLGMPATERTEVAVIYTETTMYIGVWCYDTEPEKIVAKEMRRDFDFALDDNFIVIIDTYDDNRNGFMFVTNPNGARADIQVFNNGGSTNAFWNCVWDVKAQRTAQGWFAEIQIPFFALKYPATDGIQTWGINFERNIRRKREQSRWQGWGRNFDIEDVNQAGELKGLDKLNQKRFIELKPYGLAGGEHVDGKSEGIGNVGGDINYLISPTYRLNMTFNTDFAQVEADQQQINLSRFPLFFPELREFFLEGDDFFDFGFGGNRITPFYSRRIGLSEARETVPILAGARVLGKEKNRTLGAMSIQTGNDGTNSTTNFSTLSWRQDVGEQSVIGAMTTNKIANGRWHTTTGINGRYSTSNFMGKRNLEFGGAAIQTYNTDEGLNPNAWAYRLFLSYPNDKLRIFASTQRSPAPFEPEVGLMRRRDFREYYAQLSLHPRPQKHLTWIRQFNFSPGSFTLVQYNQDGALQSFDYTLRFLGFNTRKGETVALEYQVVSEGLKDDFEIIEDVIIKSGQYWWNRWRATLSTFEGRALSINTTFTFGEFYDGNTFQNNTTLLWRANKFVTLNLRYEKNIIDLPTANFETDLISSRLSYAFNPNMFGSLLGQWNTAQEELNVNFRFQLIPKIGTDFYLIVNQLVDTKSGVFNTKRTTILAKLIWRFVI